MKKIFTVLFIVVVLLSGMTISYSAHYCQGNFIASRLSLTGKLAGCGMEQDKSESRDIRFADLMCVNEITSCTFINNYVHTDQLQEFGKNLPVVELPAVLIPVINQASAISQAVRIFPPGDSGPLRSESEILCVFRI